jgi:hypothetical protein
VIVDSAGFVVEASEEIHVVIVDKVNDAWEVVDSSRVILVGVCQHHLFPSSNKSEDERREQDLYHIFKYKL